MRTQSLIAKIVFVLSLLLRTQAFSTVKQKKAVMASNRKFSRDDTTEINFINTHPKRNIFAITKLVIFGLTSAKLVCADSIVPTPSRGFQTKSGLKYFDLVLSDKGPTPRYGQFVSFKYTIYYKPKTSDRLQVIDSTSFDGDKPFLHKHGNVRIIKAIDEVLHTMHAGSKRRIIVPNSIGYNTFALGPLPTDASRRRKLGDILDEVLADKGDLLFDIELLLIRDDENDQGYYDDEAVTPEEIKENMLKSMQRGSGPVKME